MHSESLATAACIQMVLNVTTFYMPIVEQQMCAGLRKGVTQEYSVILRKQESKFNYIHNIRELSNEYHYLLVISFGAR